MARTFGVALWSSCLAAALACAGCSDDTTGGDPGASGGGAAGPGGTTGAGTAGTGTAGTASGGTAGTGTSGTGGPGNDLDPATDGNPFADATLFVNPDYAAEIDTSIAQSPADGPLLEKVKSIPTAIWLDRIEMVGKIGGYLDQALEQQRAENKLVATVFVVYDLPNRDCHANASNGELHLEDGGMEKYKTQYIDAIKAVWQAHPNQRIIAVVEPDSLPNIATNLADPRCAAAKDAYKEAVAYAIKTLAAPNVFMYVDAAHSGWLGWPDNQTKSGEVFKEVLDAAGGPDLIRGFATNVANYTVLDATKPPVDTFAYDGNPCHDETSYVAALTTAYQALGITKTNFIIDTSRNGVGGIRHAWGNWCNVKGAGMGERPRANPGIPNVDAFYWVKPPGESDGVADSTQPRFDSACGSGNVDASPGAPQAGQWFHEFFVQAAKNANPPL